MEPMLTIAVRAAQRAGDYIARESTYTDRLTIEQKAPGDFVSEVDRQAEKLIVEALQKIYPEHGFVGEEGEAIKPDASHIWLIDPLDGTTNFLRGIPHYGVSVGCLVNGRLEHAVVYDPARRETFSASRGRGAYVNGRRMRVTGITGLEGALIGTGTPFGTRNIEQLPAYMQALQAMLPASAGMRRAGSAALDLAYVAAGRLDVFWELELNRWDIAAGVLLVTEAGGLVADMKGGMDYLETGNIVAGGPKCFKATLKTLGVYFDGA